MSDAQKLPRRLGLPSALGLVIGVTIGSGIFRTPAQIALAVPDPIWMLALWVLGGIISLCGALSLAELAAAMPQAGGLYVYLREGWGRPVAFLFGWSELVLIRASALAAIATVFAEYLLRSAGLDASSRDTAVQWTAAAAIMLVTAVNIRGVRLGAWLTGISTAAKTTALGAMVLGSFLLGGGYGGTLSHFNRTAGPVDPRLLGVALISVLWAYDGFADLSFAAGEVQNPQRTLPRALAIGTITIIVIYVLANAAYLYVLPVEGIAHSPLIAADTVSAWLGSAGAALVSVVVAISTFGALNGSMLMAPRIFFAMAADGMLFQSLARVHPRYQTPYTAILLASLLGVGFVLTGTFEGLVDTFVLALWPFYGLGVAAIYRLRRLRPDLTRPYRVTGYPAVPFVFLLGVIYLVTSSLITDAVGTSIVFLLILAGVPAYYALVPPRARAARV